MRRLMADIGWRKQRWIAPLLFAGLVPAWWLAGRSGENLGWVFGYSMGMTFMLGPQVLNPSLMPRPVLYLPIAKRDIWRATWWLATVGATLVTGSAKVVGILISRAGGSLPLPTLVLSSLYDFAYTGLGCALILIGNRAPFAGGRLRPVRPAVDGVVQLLLPLGLTAGILGGQAIGRALPVQWSDLTARGGMLLAAALGLTIAAYFHPPALPAHPSRLFWSRRTPVKSGPPRFEPGRVSGLPRLLLHEAAWTATVGGALVIAAMLIVFVAARLAESPDGFIGLLRSMLLQLDGQAPARPEHGLNAFIALIAFTFFAAALAARFPAMLRHLRVLPIGAARLNALLTGWPAVFWLSAWTGLLALHYVILGEGAVSYHADALVGLIGVNAIVRALTLRFEGFGKLLLLVPMMLAVPLLFFLEAPPPLALVALGIGGLAAAAVLNHRALAESAPYEPVGPVIGGPSML